MVLGRWRAFWLGLVLTTAILGMVWAASADVVALSIVPGSSTGRLVTQLVALDPDTFTVTKGRAQVIAGINLYDVIGVATEFHDRLVLRLYILNPADMERIWGSPNAYVEILVTNLADAKQVYGSTLLSRQLAYAMIRPSLPLAVDSFRIRASVVVPGGSPPGIQEDYLGALRFRLEVSPR